MSAAPVPMYNPDDNTTRMVPPERMDEATGAGWEPATKMISPKGASQWIPKSRMDEASKAGYASAPSAAPGGQFAGSATVPSKGGSISPQAAASMQQSNVGIAMGGEDGGVANPQQPAEQFAIQNPEQQGKLAGAAAIGAGGAGATEIAAAALPSVVPTTVAGIKAIGVWAKANPVHAYVVYQALKELLPGFKKATGLIKGAPAE